MSMLMQTGSSNGRRFWMTEICLVIICFTFASCSGTGKIAAAHWMGATAVRKMSETRLQLGTFAHSANDSHVLLIFAWRDASWRRGLLIADGSDLVPPTPELIYGVQLPMSHVRFILILFQALASSWCCVVFVFSCLQAYFLARTFYSFFFIYLLIFLFFHQCVILVILNLLL